MPSVPRSTMISCNGSALSAGATNGWTARSQDRTQEVMMASSSTRPRPRTCITQRPSWRTLVSVRWLVAWPIMATRTRDDTAWVGGETSEFSVLVKPFRMDGLEIVDIGKDAVAHGDIAILQSLAVHP